MAHPYSPFRVLHHEQAIAPDSWISEVDSSIRRHFLLSLEDEYELADCSLRTHGKVQVPLGNLRAGGEYILCVAKWSWHHSALTHVGRFIRARTQKAAHYFCGTQISHSICASAEDRAAVKFDLLVDVGVINEGDNRLYQTGLKVQ